MTFFMQTFYKMSDINKQYYAKMSELLIGIVIEKVEKN